MLDGFHDNGGGVELSEKAPVMERLNCKITRFTLDKVKGEEVLWWGWGGEGVRRKKRRRVFF